MLFKVSCNYSAVETFFCLDLQLDFKKLYFLSGFFLFSILTMRKHKNLILFILIVFFWSCFVSMIKFFLRSYLKQVNISLEEIMWYMSLGCVVSYLISWSLARIFRKKNILIVTIIMTIILVSIWQLLWFVPFPVFVILISSIGLMYGVWTVIKSIILTMEIQRSEFSETSVNGTVNIAILWWTILWSYLWFGAYAWWGVHGFWALIALMFMALIASLFLNYDQWFQKNHNLSAIREAIPSIIGVIKKYIWLLVPIGVLRAISVGIGQKMLELGIDVFNKVPKSSIIIIVISIVWAIVGHVVSAFFTKNKRMISMVFTILLGLSTFYFPYIINKYDYYVTLNISSFIMGVFFGIAVNLLEWRFFYHIGEDHRKEYGSAAYGIATNIVIFFIMIISDLLTNKIGMIIPFIFFGITLLIMPLFIRKFR